MSSSITAGTGTASNSASQALEQLLTAFQSETSQNNSFNPMSMIMNTLSSNGITPTNG